MANNWVFLVHGVGKHEGTDWSDRWKKALLDQLQQYAPYGSMTHEEIEDRYLAIVPVGYDAIFEGGFRERWGDLAGALADNSIAMGSPAAKAIEWVAEHQSDDAIQKFFWEKALDALLWLAFPTARAAVMVRVAKQLADGVEQMRSKIDRLDSAHIIAHSLGTSVVHDTLIAMAFDDSVNQAVLDPDHFKWRSVSMLANTSRLLQPRRDLVDGATLDDFKAHGSRLRPGHPQSITRSYYNYRHRADPITWPRMFDPSWPGGSYSNVETRRYDNLKSVHDFTNYVEAPFVHLSILQAILQDSTVGSSDEYREAQRLFELEHANQAGDEFRQLRELLNGDFELELSTRQIIEFLVMAYKELK